MSQSQCEYVLLKSGYLVGFSLTFLRGRQWDRYMTDKGSLFHLSPIARVMLVIKVGRVMR